MCVCERDRERVSWRERERRDRKQAKTHRNSYVSMTSIIGNRPQSVVLHFFT